jgi:hypothetical protein
LILQDTENHWSLLYYKYNEIITNGIKNVFKLQHKKSTV